MSDTELVSIGAAIASIIVASLAILLSVAFFWMSHRMSENTIEAAEMKFPGKGFGPGPGNVS
jgi:hypothetical protein